MHKPLKESTMEAMAMMMLGASAVMPDDPPLPKRTCKDCYFYMGGTYCKQVKHHVSKQTPANGCVYFKEK
jgi:hypothetical protein